MMKCSNRCRRFRGKRLLAAHLLLLLCLDVSAQSGSGTISWSEALDQDPGWYGSAEAVRIADNVVIYQNVTGGWPKNTEMAAMLTDADIRQIREQQAEAGSLLSRSTIDNGATHTQLHYLGRVYAAAEHERFRNAFLRGVDYLLDAQYDNGGWPQIYPLREDISQHITFNDDAMIGVMELLRDVARERSPFQFVDPERRRRAAAAIEKGLDVILQTQVEVGGRLNSWCAQYDHQDLTCAKARTYELASLSGAESVGITRYLMEIDEPGPEVIRAVEGAVEWFERVKLDDLRLIEKPDPSLPGGYDIVVGFDPVGATPIWARFYEIGTNYPMFVGRDGIVRDALHEIEHERRVGYSYLGSWARDLLEKEYPAWRKRRAEE